MEDEPSERILLEFLSRLPEPLIPIEVSRVLIKIQESKLVYIVLVNTYLSLCQSTGRTIPTCVTAGSATLSTARAVPGRFWPWLSSSARPSSPSVWPGPGWPPATTWARLWSVLCLAQTGDFTSDLSLRRRPARRDISWGGSSQSWSLSTGPSLRSSPVWTTPHTRTSVSPERGTILRRMSVPRISRQCKLRITDVAG